MKTNADIQINSDMGLAAIQAYLEELGDRGSTEPYSGLASACSIVLDGQLIAAMIRKGTVVVADCTRNLHHTICIGGSHNHLFRQGVYCYSRQGRDPPV